MPSVTEQRLAGFFTSSYKSAHEGNPVISLHCDKKQEAPDAICTLADGKVVGLELTSVFAPKGTDARKAPHKNPNLRPLSEILDRKLSYDYKGEGMDEVWLLVHLRLTLPRDLVEKAIGGIIIPTSRYSRVFLQWPLPEKDEFISVKVLELPELKFWSPNLPRPFHT